MNTWKRSLALLVTIAIMVVSTGMPGMAFSEENAIAAYEDGEVAAKLEEAEVVESEDLSLGEKGLGESCPPETADPESSSASDTGTRANVSNGPSSIRFIESELEMRPGEEEDLMDYIEMNPEDAETTYSWKSSKKKVAKVDKDGMVTAVGSGSTKITVKTKNKKKATIKITVPQNKIKDLCEIPTRDDYDEIEGGWTLWPVSIEVNSKGRIVCEFYLLNGTGEKSKRIQDMRISLAVGTPDNTVAETSFSKINVSCKNNKYKKFKVTFPAHTVMQKDVFFPDYEDDIYFDIEETNSFGLRAGKGLYDFIPTMFPRPEPVAFSAYLSKDNLKLLPGNSHTLTVTIIPETTRIVSTTWASSNPEIASVGQDGKIEAIKKGETTVTVTVVSESGQIKSRECIVTVDDDEGQHQSDPTDPVAVTSITLDQTNASITEGQTLSLRILPEDTQIFSAVWTSSDETVARVDQSGIVTAIKEGAATIKVTALSEFGEETAQCDVTVMKLPHDSDYLMSDGVITGYTGMGGDIALPAKDNEGKPITAIGEGAFMGKTTITSVSIPASVTEIRASAFENCSELDSVTIPNSVAQIGKAGFRYCTKLSNMTPFDAPYASVNNTNLTLSNDDYYNEIVEEPVASVSLNLAEPFAGTVMLPSNLTVVGEEAFKGCTTLYSVIVPEGVKEIEARAFADSSVKEIYLPSTLETVKEDALPAPGTLMVTAPVGSRAYEWASEHGYIGSTAESLTIESKSVKSIENIDSMDLNTLNALYKNAFISIDEATVNSLMEEYHNPRTYSTCLLYKIARHNTDILQSKIDSASGEGGTVTMPSGDFYFAPGGVNPTATDIAFVIKLRSNVTLKGSSMRKTVLKPLADRTKCINPEEADKEYAKTCGKVNDEGFCDGYLQSNKKGVDMFYFNDYKDNGTKYEDNDSYYLINAHFSDFTVDGNRTSQGEYDSAGKGFMINLFMNCSFKNVTVKNTDGSGFGIDCPINVLIDDCVAEGCGKAAGTTGPGGSGFGIGTGYRDGESLKLQTSRKSLRRA